MATSMNQTGTKTIKSLSDYLKDLKEVKAIKIMGCNPLVSVLSSQEFEVQLRKKLLALFESENKTKNSTFITLYMESEQEDFYQQITDKEGSVSYKNKYVDRKARIFGIEQANYKSVLTADITKQIITRYKLDDEKIPEGLLKYVDENIDVRQMNYRLSYDAVCIETLDGILVWYHPLSREIPGIDDLLYLDQANPVMKRIYDIIMSDFEFFENEGSKYTSKPNSELIEAYNKNNKRVAIFDRKAFLTLEYKRASIWGFIFNRKGELLLHKRSDTTADNRSMWDKSTGGHVDLTDASTAETAKREFIEELYLKDAEYSNYNTSNTEMVVDFGEWRRGLRQDESFVESFAPFTGKDKHVIMFRAFTEGSDTPLTIDRASVRKITKTDKDGKDIVSFKDTRFKSDVFFFITATEQIDDEEQMKKTFADIENFDGKTNGAAAGHKLITIPELVKTVLENPSDYTDDMVYFVKDYSGYLTEFSSFVKDIFERINKG